MAQHTAENTGEMNTTPETFREQFPRIPLLLPLWRAAALLLAGLALLCAPAQASHKKDKAGKPVEPSALDRYVADALKEAQQKPPAAAGSLYQPGAPLGNLFRDPRASQLNDVVTITVAESLSALSSGTTKTSRTSSASASVGALGHKYGGSSAMANLANMNGSNALDGAGSTMRQTSLTTSMSARVVQVLPNGYLIIEGRKTVQVNSEQQTIVVRGAVRPIDLASDNTIQSDHLAQMEISVNGKGVVGDAIRRPGLLYRLLLGLLPF